MVKHKESQLEVQAKTQKSRDLRSKLRSLNETIRHDGEDLADHTKNLLAERVNALNDLSKQVVRPSEQADDSEAFYVLTQRGAEMAKRVAVGKGRTANDFIRHLKAAFVSALDAQQEGALDPNAFDWKRLGRSVQRYFRHAPGASCLLGPMDAVPKVKQRTATQRLQKKPVGAAVAPQVLQVEDAEAQEKRETERNMQTMWNILKKAPDGVGFLELTMNHHSFAQFAENLFTLSFLVHNARAKITKDGPQNTRGLMVFPIITDKNTQRDSRDKGAQRMQLVLAYDMAQWREWRRYLRPQDCLMPHREEEDAELAQAAPGEDDGPDPYDEGPSQRSKAARKSQGLLDEATRREASEGEGPSERKRLKTGGQARKQ